VTCDPKTPAGWRAYLTAEEAAILAAADAAKAEWLKLSASRAGIVNRAIQRMRHRQGKTHRQKAKRAYEEGTTV
jgi:hypothetical protein